MNELLEKLQNHMKRDQRDQRTFSHLSVRTYAWQQAMDIVQKHFRDEDKQTATGGNQVSFDQVVQERTDAIHNTLDKKAKEYASKTDRFHNFRVAARINKTTPERALKGMMLKHEVSVLDMIENPYNLSEEMINEKIGDNINYLILLEGLLKERLQS